MGFKGKVEIADGTDDGNVPSAMLAMATSIFTRVVNYYATEAERTTETAVPSKMSAAEKLGMLCWVDSRKGHYQWDGTVWKPLAICDELYVGTRPSAAQATGATSIDILLPGAIVLPAGNRRVRISAVSGAKNPDGVGYATAPRMYVSGPGMGATDFAQIYCPVGVFNSQTIPLVRTVIVSGTCTWTMTGINGTSSPSQVAEFINSRLEIFDLGPAD